MRVRWIYWRLIDIEDENNLLKTEIERKDFQSFELNFVLEREFGQMKRFFKRKFRKEKKFWSKIELKKKKISFFQKCFSRTFSVSLISKTFCNTWSISHRTKENLDQYEFVFISRKTILIAENLLSLCLSHLKFFYFFQHHLNERILFVFENLCSLSHTEVFTTCSDLFITWKENVCPFSLHFSSTVSF